MRMIFFVVLFWIGWAGLFLRVLIQHPPKSFTDVVGYVCFAGMLFVWPVALGLSLITEYGE